jgi:curved DNA-binding protein CbpA
MQKKNYYDILEITTEATDKEIQEAYRRAYNSYAGDSVAMYSLMTKEECEEILQQIEEAFSVLGDPQKREEYDLVRGIRKNKTSSNFDFTYKESGIHSASNLAGMSPTPQDNVNDVSGIVNSPFNIGQPANQQSTEQRRQNDLIGETQIRADEMKKDVGEDRGKFVYNEVAQKSNEAVVSKFSALKKFSLDYNSDTDFEQKIENCTDFTGKFLKQIREYKNVTIDRLAEMTRISKTYIKLIEADEYVKLPADVYTRGFVYQYAKCLKLNPDLVATSYIHHLKQARV